MNTVVKENPDKNYLLALGLSYFLGSFGVDRYYLGKIATGVLKMVTLGGLGIWSMIDFFRLAFGGLKAKDNMLPLEGYAKYSKTMKMVSAVVLAINVIIVLVYVGLLGFATKNGLDMRADNKTYANATYMADSLQTYILNEHSIPSSLQDVAVLSADELGGLSYHKDSDTAYTFCATYKRAGNSGNGAPDTYAPSVYSDPQSLYIPVKHLAGANCRTITPVIPAPSAAAGKVDSASAEAMQGCNISGISKSAIGTGTINSLKSLPKTETGDVFYRFTLPSRKGGDTYDVRNTTMVYDAQCQPLELSYPDAGDMVDIFIVEGFQLPDPDGPIPAAVVIDRTER